MSRASLVRLILLLASAASLTVAHLRIVRAEDAPSTPNAADPASAPKSTGFPIERWPANELPLEDIADLPTEQDITGQTNTDERERQNQRNRARLQQRPGAQPGLPMPAQAGRPGSDLQLRPSTPAFGNPPGFGAGLTGFISTNPRPLRRRDNRRGLRVVPDASGGYITIQGRNGSRRGASGTASQQTGQGGSAPSRPGLPLETSAVVPPRPIPRVRTPEIDPYDPLGIHAGSFIVKPAVELTGGYDTAPSRTQSSRGSAFGLVSPELQVRSDWNRHALNADLRGSYIAYENASALNRPFADMRANGRIDITSLTRSDIEARVLVGTDNPGSPNLQADLARLPIFTDVGGTVGFTQRFNYLEVGARGIVDRVTFEKSLLTDGTTSSNEDRNYLQYGTVGRVAYELLPGTKPFVEGAYDTRERDLPIDKFGFRRDSEGFSARAGSSFELGARLKGELSIGYLVRTYKDPNLPDLKGLIADGSLIYTASALTSARLTLRSTADETVVPGVSGILRRDIGLQVEHSFRRWLVGTVRFAYGHDTYTGGTRLDDRYLAALGIVYKLNREMHLKGEIRQEWLRSNVTGANYSATVALFGIRLQR